MPRSRRAAPPPARAPPPPARAPPPLARRRRGESRARFFREDPRREFNRKKIRPSHARALGAPLSRAPNKPARRRRWRRRRPRARAAAAGRVRADARGAADGARPAAAGRELHGPDGVNVASGMAIGTGSALARSAIGSLFGGGGSRRPRRRPRSPRAARCRRRSCAASSRTTTTWRCAARSTTSSTRARRSTASSKLPPLSRPRGGAERAARDVEPLERRHAARSDQGVGWGWEIRRERERAREREMSRARARRRRRWALRCLDSDERIRARRRVPGSVLVVPVRRKIGRAHGTGRAGTASTSSSRAREPRARLLEARDLGARIDKTGAGRRAVSAAQS